MKKGVKVSFSVVDMTEKPGDWIFELEEAGFSGWEIIDEGEQKVSNMTDEIEEILHSTDLVLSIHAPLSDLNIASLNDGIWEESVRQIEESIKRAYEFVEKICVVHPGSLSPLSIKNPEKAFERAVAGLKRICWCADEHGLLIAVENMTNIVPLICRQPEELLHIINEVNEDNIGICFDVGHANTTKNMDDFLVDDVMKRVIHVHASDNHGDDDRHLPLGSGNIDWKKVFRKLQDNRYGGRIVLEMNSLGDGIESLRYLNSL